MEYSENQNGDQYDLSLSGKFTFADRKFFKDLFIKIREGNIKHLTIGLSEIEFVDSAALGILLLARDEAEKLQINLVLKSPKDQVKKMFEISRFYELFQIEE